MNSKSLPLAVDPSAGKAASALPDIPFTVREAAVFLGDSPQMMMSVEVSEGKRP